MLLQGKKILIMGIRNKWSIAWGAAQSAYEQGAQIIFTYNSEENKPKIEKLMEEIPGSKAYSCNVSSDESIKICFETILKENGKIDGILHAIAHANTEDLRNDFINTSRDGFSHACDISSYSLIAVSRIASELGLLNNNSSIVTLSYYGAEKNIEGYNVMGIAKAALESSVRYLTKDLGKNGTRINAISAGPIKTLSSKGKKNLGNILDIVEEKSPLHRNVTAKEVGDCCTFLFSNMSSAITGEVIHVDNGFSVIGV